MLNDLKTAGLFVVLYVSTIFVNKYILSVLKFQFPTIFQGWQTLFGLLTLRALCLYGKINMEPSKISGLRMAPWLPAMICYVISIYAGSVALSQISVPIFLSLQNMAPFFSIATELVMQRKLSNVQSYVTLMVIFVSAVMVILSDPQYSQMGYIWMTVHVLATGAYNVYEVLLGSKVPLSGLEKIYCNYLYSGILLIPSSYFLGEVLASQHFPHWYFSKFYVGCLLSGVFGLMLNLCLIHWAIPSDADLSITKVLSFAKMAAAVTSILVFPTMYTASHAMWIAINLSTNSAFAFATSTEIPSSNAANTHLVSPPSAKPDTMDDTIKWDEIKT